MATEIKVYTPAQMDKIMQLEKVVVESRSINETLKHIGPFDRIVTLHPYDNPRQAARTRQIINNQHMFGRFLIERALREDVLRG